MAYTKEQIEKYRLTPEQIGTFQPKLSGLELEIIRNYAQPTNITPRKSAQLFRQQLMEEEPAKKNQGSEKSPFSPGVLAYIGVIS